MARHLFGGGLDAWTFDLGDPATAGSGASGNLAVVVPSVVVTFYDSDVGGSLLSDLTTTTGGAISSVTSDASGEIPQFYGPDNVYSMWADASGGAGPRRQVTASDIGPDVAALAEQVSNLQNAVDNLTSTVALVAVVNPEALGSYPARPALAGTRVVFWVGDDTPASGGTGMAEGDIYIDTAP